MAEHDDQFDDTGADANDDIRKLRAKARKADAMEAELNQLRRERAFTKAGIDPDDPKMRYFIKGYDGEDDPEAIRTAALEAGFIAQEPEQSEEQRQQAETHQRMDTAQAGAQGIQPPEPLSREAMAQAMEQGGSEGLLALLETQGIPVS